SASPAASTASVGLVAPRSANEPLPIPAGAEKRAARAAATTRRRMRSPFLASRREDTARSLREVVDRAAGALVHVATAVRHLRLRSGRGGVHRLLDLGGARLRELLAQLVDGRALRLGARLAPPLQEKGAQAERPGEQREQAF